mmetsp:Transcript_47294/g.107248  ORF Transcript_47294/g.107248 Transcript_47294/m.107248 type:complete len:236 (-) Transcript_47294:409-1116(-)
MSLLASRDAAKPMALTLPPPGAAEVTDDGAGSFALDSDGASLCTDAPSGAAADSLGGAFLALALPVAFGALETGLALPFGWGVAGEARPADADSFTSSAGACTASLLRLLLLGTSLPVRGAALGFAAALPALPLAFAEDSVSASWVAGAFGGAFVGSMSSSSSVSAAGLLGPFDAAFALAELPPGSDASFSGAEEGLGLCSAALFRAEGLSLTFGPSTDPLLRLLLRDRCLEASA